MMPELTLNAFKRDGGKIKKERQQGKERRIANIVVKLNERKKLILNMIHVVYFYINILIFDMIRRTCIIYYYITTSLSLLFFATLPPIKFFALLIFKNAWDHPLFLPKRMY